MVYALEESGGSEGRHLRKSSANGATCNHTVGRLLALTLKQRKDEKRAREVAAEIERTATSDNFYTSWESQPQTDARLCRAERHRSHRAFTEGAGSHQA